jgi:hypothetical protein
MTGATPQSASSERAALAATNPHLGKTARHGGVVGAMLAAVALLAVALLAVACGGGGDSGSPGVASLGSSSPSGSSAASASSSSTVSKDGALLAYARCMRAHGVTDFPDPQPNGHGGSGFDLGGSGDLNPDNPIYEAANQACVSLLPGGAAHQQAEQARQRAQGLNFARCMRAHGIHKFPDPNADGQFPTTGGYGKGSPQFTAAQQACQHYLND